MHSWLDAATISALIPIVAMLIPIVAIIAGVVQWWHGEALRHETIRSLAQSGQPIPPELLRRTKGGGGDDDESHSASRDHSRFLRGGLILLCLGLGTGALLYFVSPGDWLWSIGLVPGSLGLALILIWKIESRSFATAGPSPR